MPCWPPVRSGKRGVKASPSRKANRIWTPVWATRSSWRSSVKCRSTDCNSVSPRAMWFHSAWSICANHSHCGHRADAGGLLSRPGWPGSRWWCRAPSGWDPISASRSERCQLATPGPRTANERAALRWRLGDLYGDGLDAAAELQLEQVAVAFGGPHGLVGLVAGAQFEAEVVALIDHGGFLDDLEVAGVQAVGQPQQGG